MIYKRLFLDSDVLLDMFLKRESFFFYTQILLMESEKRKLELKTSSLVIANINYILRKQIGISTTKESIKKLAGSIDILPFEKDAIDFALASNIVDFEDAIQCFIAKKSNCDLIITRNIKDYKNSLIPVLTADQFLRTL